MLNLSRYFVRARLSSGLILLSALPINVHAHVKWFTNADANHILPSFTRMEVGVSIVLLLMGVAIAKILNDYCVQQSCVLSSRIAHDLKPLRISQYFLVIYLVGCAWSGNLLVPHIHFDQVITWAGVFTQWLIATLLILRYKLGVTAILLCLLFLIVGAHEYSFVVEYMLLVGIAWIVFVGQKVPSNYSIAFLRVTLGVSLIALALTEKLLQPELALNVLAQYPLNFIQHLGMTFSDSWFVLGAGMVELLIGIFFVLGLMVRTTALVIMGLMAASNAYFFCAGNYSLAIMELIGHLPVFAAGVLLLFYYGQAAPKVQVQDFYKPVSEV